MPHTLRDDEGVAADRDGNVVMPTGETSPLEVVEPELALHLLVDALSAVALLEEAHKLLLAHLATQRGEREVRRFSFTVGPLDEEQYWFALCGFRPIIICNFHSAECESRAELAPLRRRSIAPRDAAERLGSKPRRDGTRVLGVGDTPLKRIEPPHLLRCLDAEGVVEAVISHRAAESMGSAIPAVAEHDAPGTRPPRRDRSSPAPVLPSS